MSGKVSVILPLYNNKEYILESIQSVIKQTYKNWELIVVDDCSTDGSYELVKDYLEKEKQENIKLLRNDKNVGCYCSINNGILQSDGDYIAKIDSDDKYHSKKLELQVKKLEKHNYIAVQSYGIRGNEKKGRVIEATLLFKKSIINKIGYFDSVRFGGDTEFRRRITRVYKVKIHVIPEVLYFAKKRKNSLTTSSLSGNKNIRRKYVTNFTNWYKSKKKIYMDYPLKERPFPVSTKML